MADPRDIELRNAALDHVRDFSGGTTTLFPIAALVDGFRFGGQRISLGAPFYRGIFRPKELAGPAALVAGHRAAENRSTRSLRRRVRRSHGAVHVQVPRSTSADGRGSAAGGCRQWRTRRGP